MAGKLTLVSTPIGNLDDFSPRGRQALDGADYILCEDARHTAKLCTRFGIQTPRRAFHEHNEEKLQERILADLATGQAVALVSDAGTPLVNDPGFKLVRAAIDRGFAVHAVPGPSAPTMALTLSGFPPTPWACFGFLPHRSQRRDATAAEIANWSHTAVVFLSPHRGNEELQSLRAAAGDRDAALLREMTKIHEEVIRGTLSSILAEIDDNPRRGEWTLVLGPADPATTPEPEELVATAEQRATEDGISRKEAAFQVALEHGLPRRSVYRIMLQDGPAGD